MVVFVDRSISFGIKTVTLDFPKGSMDGGTEPDAAGLLEDSL